ncbi:hypothetical protein [Shewanella sp. SG41-3]|uniref:hypothetical protein n=1 Tax=Shewanella sp. SG41-3 TaxID=2760977 RepID=UPI0015FF759B|nr:hypothetical protein [Shewanella sp. SG41-3]MBB1474349.1 hypothetical protein [Shewanella sp. SG41-3]
MLFEQNIITVSYLSKFIVHLFCCFIFVVVTIANKDITNRLKNYTILAVLFITTLNLILSNVNGQLMFVGPAFIVFALLVLYPPDFHKKTLNCFINIYVIVISVGLLLHMLSLFDLIQPTSQQLPMNQLKLNSQLIYDVYYGFYSTSSSIYGNSIRFSSVFDEAGVVGTLSGLLLLTPQLTKSKFNLCVVLVSGFLSLSTFFFILFVFFILRNKKWLLISTFILPLILFLWYVLNIQSFDLFYDFVSWKVSAGDNRISDCFYSHFTQDINNFLYFGAGAGMSQSLGCDVSSGITLFYDYGYAGGVLLILGTLLIIGFSVYKFTPIRNLLTKVTFFILIFSICFYQRPSLYSIFYFQIYLSIFYFVYSVNDGKSKCN